MPGQLDHQRRIKQTEQRNLAHVTHRRREMIDKRVAQTDCTQGLSIEARASRECKPGWFKRRPLTFFIPEARLIVIPAIVGVPMLDVNIRQWVVKTSGAEINT